MWGGSDELDVATADVTDSGLVAEVPNTAVMGTAAGTLEGTATLDFLRFVDARSSGAASLSHVYTADGLRQLAAALKEIASGDSVGGVALQPRIDEIRDRANAMQQNPTDTDHALQTRKAFNLASSVMMQMQGNNGRTDGRLSALQDAAMAIQPSVPLLEQAENIDRFFTQAAQALRTMTNAPA